MSAERQAEGTREGTAGFAVLDDKGRISLPKALRATLGLHAGSPVAYIALADTILLVPQDEHLTALAERATRALATAGITLDDFLDNVPRAREEVVTEAYGPTFLRDLEQRYAPHDTDEPTR